MAAYSVRRLFRDYAGPQVRIRRSSDDKEANVYFDRNGKVTLVKAEDGETSKSLDNWLDGSDARALRIFDQSGNNRTLKSDFDNAPELAEFEGRWRLLFDQSRKTMPKTDYDPGLNLKEMTLIQKVHMTEDPGEWTAVANHMSSSSLREYAIYIRPTDDVHALQRYGEESNWASSFNPNTEVIGNWVKIVGKNDMNTGIGKVYDKTNTTTARQTVSLSPSQVESFTEATEGFRIGGEPYRHTTFSGYIDYTLLFSEFIKDDRSIVKQLD